MILNFCRDTVNAAVILQSAWRMRLARRTAAVLRRQLEERRLAAAKTLQGAWRCRVARERLTTLRAERCHTELCQKAAVTIQTWFRIRREIRAQEIQAQIDLQTQVSI
jgi:IQ calmodulin-binding motif